MAGPRAPRQGARPRSGLVIWKSPMPRSRVCPNGLPRPCSLRRNLSAPGCYAAENRGDEAAACSLRQSTAATNSSRPQAIYYRVDAALKAGIMSDADSHRRARAAALSLARRHAGTEDAAQARIALFRQSKAGAKACRRCVSPRRTFPMTTWHARPRTICAPRSSSCS